MFNLHVTITYVNLEYFNHKTVIVKIALERPDLSLTGYRMRASLGEVRLLLQMEAGARPTLRLL